MGTPDTLHIKKGIKCPICGTLVYSFQSHAFNDIMMHFWPGDLVETDVLSGIMETCLFCPNSKNHQKEAEDKPWPKVFIIIWHKIFIDILETTEKAQDRFQNISLGDIVLLLHEVQEDRRKYRNNYQYILNSLESYARFLDEPPEKQEKLKSEENKTEGFEWIIYHGLHKHLQEKNPLKSLLEEIKHHVEPNTDEESDGLFI